MPRSTQLSVPYHKADAILQRIDGIEGVINLAPNDLGLMALAGAIAAVGLWSETLHLVVGAMVIAPAFEPLLRLSFGVIAGPGRIARSGLVSAATGYFMLALGGLPALLILQTVDPVSSGDLAA